MPIQTFDFSRLIPKSQYQKQQAYIPDYSFIENLSPNLYEAFQSGKQLKIDREAAERQKKAEELSNLFLEKYGPQEKEAKLALLRAQAAHEGRLASGIGMGGGGGALSSSGSDMGMSRSGITHGLRIWNSLPANVKNDAIATGVGLGYTPDEVAIALSSGKTLKQLAESAGKDIGDVEKVYAPTTPNITQMKNQEGALAEIDVLEDKTTNAMSPYSRKFFGYSPKQITESLSGTNTDEQARYLAARAMQPELAGVRTRLAGGSNAQEALSDMTQKSLGNAKIFEPLVSPEVYEKTQRYMNQWLKEATHARTKAIRGQTRETDLYGQRFTGDLSRGAHEMVLIKNEKTGETKLVPFQEAQNMGAQ